MISFHEIWREVFRQIQLQSPKGENLLEDQVPEAPNSEDIRYIFEQVGNPSIVVIDEFDRADETVAVAMSDTKLFPIEMPSLHWC
jgi:hypothetical protein